MWFTATQLPIYFLINQLKILGGIIMKTTVKTLVDAIVTSFITKPNNEENMKRKLLFEQEKEKRKWIYTL